jgi:hypothetical protein
LQQIAEVDSPAPAQLPGFVAAKAEYVEEAIGTLDMAEDIAHVGAGWEKRVDCCNQSAFVRKNTLMGLNLSDSPCCQGSNARNVIARPNAIFGNTREMHNVSAPRRL